MFRVECRRVSHVLVVVEIGPGSSVAEFRRVPAPAESFETRSFVRSYTVSTVLSPVVFG